MTGKRMQKKIKKPELLAPAGNILKMKTAFAFGADAVYLGIPDFSLRVRINDFKISDIRKAVKYARKINKKIYITVNIFAHNSHIKKLPKYIKILRELKPDGLFISDPGIMAIIKKAWPKANIILSTQANCTNIESARFWQKQGIKRIILGRELSLKEIKEIKKTLPGLSLEVFVHGALCMAYSGRCFISKLINGRDANLGDCSQPCRWEYGVESRKLKVESIEIKPKGHDRIFKLIEEEHGSYILNSNDLCLIKKLPELINAGIDAFKIEGRAKSVYYLANVVGAYRRAIDVVAHNAQRKTCNAKRVTYNDSVIKNELAFLYSELEEKLFHREYTEGFMFDQGKMAQNLDNSHNSPKWEFCGVVTGAKKNKNNKKIRIKVHNTMKIGDKIEIIRPGYDILKISLKKMFNAETEKEIKEAHGGGSGHIVLIEINEDAPEYSVLRRKIS
jgi:U32 family peptidase